MRLGIFGGTFDPVHFGHLLLAECCRVQQGLEQVWFMPAASPPHKLSRELAPAAARVEMLELAIGGQETFRVCPYEIERGGVSYTVDTLARFKAEDASRELFLLLGEDSLRDFPTWKEPERIRELATLLVVGRGEAARGGAEERDSGNPPCQFVRMPRIDLSSSEIRELVAAGQSIRYRTPRAVEKYIETQGLYK